MNPVIKKFFVKNLLEYYKNFKRDLPWRDTKDPYKIWISEIILQQTQVKQALEYYYRFINQFPDVYHLAEAKEDEILHLWQGLGYYSRARNMHYAAQQIVEKWNGHFPDNYKDVIQLKGVGEYTAAAILSFAFNQPYAVLDGNVFRVLSRFFGIKLPIDTTQGKKYYLKLANDLLDKKHPAEYNQAIMEFGATYCKPQNPDCLNCLMNQHCIAYLENKVSILPIKSKSIIKKKRYFNYIIFIDKENNTYIQKRDKSDIWKGLYEFYLIESEKKFLSLKKIEQHLHQNKINFTQLFLKEKIQHILTHQELHIQFIIAKINSTLPSQLSLIKIPVSKLSHYPFPVVIGKNLNNLKK